MAPTQDFYRDLLDSISDGVYFVDLDGKITYWNRGAEKITGYPAGEVLGCRCSDGLLMHVDDRGSQLCQVGCPLAATALDGQEREAEVFLHHRDGHRVPVLVRASPMRAAGGDIVGAVEVFSERPAGWELAFRADELRRMALLDHLTEVANRRYLEMLIRSRLEELDRYGWPVGVLFVDVDHFKDVNDAFGHTVGDQALRMVAKTLSTGARSFDIVGRWGGEEFLVLLINVAKEDLEIIAERLRALVATSILSVPSQRLTLTVSVGATLATREDTVETVVARADELMYRSKKAGRNRVTSDAAGPFT
jgi:diguanylate cyclase (GGDEF)-like protein/PAS domain S-box-containing protein